MLKKLTKLQNLSFSLPYYPFIKDPLSDELMLEVNNSLMRLLNLKNLKFGIRENTMKGCKLLEILAKLAKVHPSMEEISINGCLLMLDAESLVKNLRVMAQGKRICKI